MNIINHKSYFPAPKPLSGHPLKGSHYPFPALNYWRAAAPFPWLLYPTPIIPACTVGKPTATWQDIERRNAS
ncbi:hypothetical protein CEXT_302531 [Caerostris extrusa]|uniref:Uncharacterized protein n=1 Tax=Caerostris extrusa TaxID=172846 RepID=A0AAV4MBA9_CAEEX|nr:hypothetical protein CEXT_302531 [Caerostris extrusa]